MAHTPHIVHDSRLPQLQKVLDPRFMKKFFQTGVAEEKLSGKPGIRKCEIVRMRYKPGKECVVKYTLSLGRGVPREDVFVRVNNPRDAGKQHVWWQDPGAGMVPEFSMHVWQFPYDPVLEHLPELTDPDPLRNLLFRLGLPELAGMEMDTPVNVQVLKYEPLRQCALKVEVSRSAPHAPVRLFAKLRNDDRGLQLWKAFREIGVGKAEPGDFRLSRPVAYDERRRVLWHRWSEGQDFAAFARQKGLIRACRRAAVALARFHQLEIAHLPSTTPEKNFRKLIERTNRMVQVHRQLKEPAQAVVLHLRQLSGFWHPAHQCPIHGDFNYSQLLFEGETPVLVDLDSACMGDPLYDVAHFVAGLYWLERRERFSLGDIQEAVYRFCETYRDGVPWEVPEDALHGQIALALVCRRAYKALRSLEPTMRDDMAYFLGLARHYLGKSTSYRTCAGQ